MTTGRKNISRNKFCRPCKRYFFAFFQLLILFVAVGCQTTTPTPKQATENRSPTETDELKIALNAARAVECKLMSNEWYIPGDVQRAKIVRNKNNIALVYQALLRTGPRTVYQSLTRGLAFEGDGVVVGLKNLPNVSDYEAYQNADGDVMTLSRTKAPNSELFKAMVEINVEGDTWWRPILPTDSNETVQQIWPVLPMGNGKFQIVLRTTPSDESTSSGPDDESTFYWFRLTPSTRSMDVVGKFQATQVNIQPGAFVGMEKTGEPIAIAIVKSRYDSDALDGPPSDQSARVSLVRFFSKSVQEKPLFTSKGNITDLSAAFSESSQLTHVSWLFSPKRGSSRIIQTVPLERAFFSDRFFSNTVAAPAEQSISTEFNYEGNDPSIQFLNAENREIPVLGWWGKVDSDLAVLMHLLSAQPKAPRPTPRASSKAAISANQFSPTMAILPPKNFNRILSFHIAPTTSEKNIMILSNRSESADLQKETVLHACTF